MISEKKFANGVLSDLSRFFVCQTQVRGLHWSGQNKRCDAIIRPRDNALWRNKEQAFVVEFKRLSKKITSYRFNSEIMNQLIEYAQTEWEDFGYLPILGCGHTFENFYNEHRSIGGYAHFLGSYYNVGCLKRIDNQGLAIEYCGNRVLWTQVSGVLSGKVWAFKRFIC